MYNWGVIHELTIVIPTYNEEQYLPKLLVSIAQQDFQGKLQVVVVDGLSEDNTISVAQSFQAHIADLLVISENRGTSYQRNRGADKAKYKYILFLDADIILPKKFLQRLTSKAHENSDFIDFTLHVPVKFNVFDYLFILVMTGYTSVVQFFDPALSGSFMFTTKKIHKKINGFKEGVLLGEDNDYCERAIAVGAKYHLRYFPYVLASPRRLRAEGRVNLIYLWAKSYMYIKKYGPISDPKKFRYEFGRFSGDK